MGRQVTTIKTVKQMDELVDMGESLAWHQKWRMKLSALFHQVTLAGCMLMLMLALAATCCYVSS